MIIIVIMNMNIIVIMINLIKGATCLGIKKITEDLIKTAANQLIIRTKLTATMAPSSPG